MDKLLDKARKDLSPYCIEECKAYCCRKGHILLDKKEIKRVTDISNSNKEGNLFSLNLESGCPALKEHKCSIHDIKPKTCHDFPIFSVNGGVVFSTKCPAVNDNKFYVLMHELKKKNIPFIYSCSSFKF